jgi:hypothetical protein
LASSSLTRGPRASRACSRRGGVLRPGTVAAPGAWPEEDLPPSALRSSGAAEESSTSLKDGFPLAPSACRDPGPLTQPRSWCGSGLGEKEKSMQSNGSEDTGVVGDVVAGCWRRLPE